MIARAGMPMGKAKIRVGIVGGTGYTGVELLRLLAAHPQVELVAITSRQEAGKQVAELFPNLRGAVRLAYQKPEEAGLESCAAVFFATPHGAAMELVPRLLKAGVRVVDLSADFRLKDPRAWAQWYGHAHTAPELLGSAVYGLPEMYRAQIKTAQLLACPGCYPTAVQLGFLPLLKAGVVDLNSLIADAKSGVSGAGRGAGVSMLLGEAGDSMKAYAVPGHRHWPEIKQGLDAIAGQAVGLIFVPHLAPMIRGIHATLYARLTRNSDLQALFEQHFADEAFVDVLPAGDHPETRSVRGSNICRLAVHRPQYGGGDGDTVVVLSVIDNLVKGAAGQAVQCFNLMFDLPETTGLNQIGLLP